MCIYCFRISLKATCTLSDGLYVHLKKKIHIFNLRKTKVTLKSVCAGSTKLTTIKFAMFCLKHFSCSEELSK